MGVGRGNITTNIIKNGLILNIDPANRASTVPSTSTTETFNTLNLAESGSFINDTMYDSSTTTPSYALDGVGDSIDTSMYFGVPPIDRYNKDTFTVSIWIKVDDSKLSDWQYYTPISALTNGGTGLSTRKYGNSTGYVVISGDTFGSTQLDNGNWRNLVGVFNSSNDNWKIHIDGNSTPEINQTLPSWQFFNKNIKIGQNGGDANYFPGNIGPVQYYNRILSPSEILHNYNALKGRFE